MSDHRTVQLSRRRADHRVTMQTNSQFQVGIIDEGVVGKISAVQQSVWAVWAPLSGL